MLVKIEKKEEIFMVSNDMPIITGTNYSCFKWKRSELMKVSLKSQIFVGIQFSVTSLAGIWLLMNQALLSIEASFLSFIVVLMSYSLQSMALQKDKFVYLLECFRLLLIWLIFLYLMQSSPHFLYFFFLIMCYR